MVTQIVTLLPTSVSYGHEVPPLSGDGNITQVDLPVEVGGGSVVDFDDSSYVQIGTWAEPIDTGRLDHIEPLSATFVLPSSYRNPTAVAINLRLRSDPDALIPPPDTMPSGVSASLVAVSDGTSLGVRVQDDGFSGSTYQGITFATLTDVTDRSVWFDDVDPLNPTDAGSWFEFAVDADTTAEDCVAALTGSGIRATIAVYPGILLDSDPHRRPWLDVFQFQMLVACESAGGHAPPCQIYPRDDGLGAGGPAVWPPPSSGRPGSYY